MSIIPLLYEMKLSLTLPFIPLLLSYLLKHTSSFNVAIKKYLQLLLQRILKFEPICRMYSSWEDPATYIWVCSTQIEADESSHQHRVTKGYFQSKMCKNISFISKALIRKRKIISIFIQISLPIWSLLLMKIPTTFIVQNSNFKMTHCALS